MLGKEYLKGIGKRIGKEKQRVNVYEVFGKGLNWFSLESTLVQILVVVADTQ